MNNPRNFRSFLSVFTIALAALLFNDLYFKQAYHNTLTGKLSDFAGLLVFPWFWSLYFSKKTEQIYVATTLLFIFWKTEYSQPLFNEIGSVFGFTFTRTIDLTDLIALLILPFSYLLFKRSKHEAKHLKNTLKHSLSVVCIFAFVATSAPELVVEPNFEYNASYTINCSKEVLLTTKMQSRSTKLTQAELLQLDEFTAEAFGNSLTYNFDVRMVQLDSNITEFTLVRIKSYVLDGTTKKRDALMKQQLQLRFERDVINHLNDFDENKNIYFITYQER